MVLSIASPLITSIMTLSIIGLFVLLSYTFFKKKTDIIDTYELYLKMGLALHAHIIYSLFLCTHSINILYQSGRKVDSLIELSMALLSIFPTIYLIFSYFNLNRYFRKRFKLSEPETGLIREETILYIANISEKLELKSKPIILLSAHKNIPPFVFGKTSKNSYISLPQNWDEIFGKISLNNKTVERNLKHFVLIHELSHLKHRDHVFIAASYFFLKALKYWTLAVILLVAILSIIKNLGQLILSFTPLFWGLLFYAIIFLLTLSISRNREFLADARASLLMSENELKSILTRNVKFKSSMTSYMEILNRFFSTEKVSKTNIVGISGSRTILSHLFKIMSKVLGKKISELFYEVFSTHPVEELRVKKLKKKYFVKPTQNIVSQGLAFWIGIISAFFLFNSFLYPNDIRNLLSESINVKTPILTVGKLFVAFIVFFVPISFSVPLRNSVISMSSFRMYLETLSNRYITAYSSFFTTTICLFSIIIISRSDIKVDLGFLVLKLILRTFFQYLPLFLVGFVVSTIIGYVHFNTMPYLYHLESSLRNTQLILLLLRLIFVGLFAIILNLLGIKFFSIIIGCLVGVTISTFQEMRLPIITDHLSKWQIIGNQKFVRKSELKGILGLSLWIYLLDFFLAMTIFGIIFNFIKSIKIHFIVYLGNMGILLYLGTKNKEIFLPPNYCGTGTILGIINRYLFILKLFNSQKVQKEKELISRMIRDCKLEDNSYPQHRMINIGTAFSSFQAVSSLLHLQINDVQKNTAEWFLKLENDSGGFAPITGLESRLSSTYMALYVLSNFNLIPQINTGLHSSWIKSLQKEEGYFSDSISKFSEIQQTFFALGSLHLLGSMGMINGKKCIEWVKKAWERSKKDFDSSFYSIKCLELLGELSDEIKREVIDDWLSPNSVVLKNLQVDNHLPLFYFFFKIAETVINGEEDIKNLEPSLGEKIYDSFVKYLKKVIKGDT